MNSTLKNEIEHCTIGPEKVLSAHTSARLLHYASLCFEKQHLLYLEQQLINLMGRREFWHLSPVNLAILIN